jgi:hypothetical protein
MHTRFFTFVGTARPGIAIRSMAVLCFAVSAAWAEPTAVPKISPELVAAAGGSQPVEVIVQYRVAPTEAHRQKIQQLGGSLRARMDFINAAQYKFRRPFWRTWPTILTSST